MFGAKICLLGKSKCFYLTGSLSEYIFKIGIIYICNPDLTLSEKQSLTSLIVFKILMLIRSNMIFPQICKNSDFKWNSCRPMQHQPL